MKLKKLLNNIRYQIFSFFFYKSPIYLNLNIFKIYRYYWTARKYFQKPILRFYKMNIEDSLGSDYFFLETECWNKWLYINCHHCEWKSKYTEIRFESVPHICIILFNKYKYVIGLEAPLYTDTGGKWRPDNDLYWEAILGYCLEFKKDLVKTYNNNIWGRHYYDIYTSKGEEVRKKVNIYSTIFPALTKKGKDLIVEWQKEDSKSD